MAPTVEKLPVPQLLLGEGPHWNPKTESLYLVDIKGSTLYRYHPASNKVYAVKLDVPSVGFITPVAGSTDKFVIGAGQALRLVQWDGVSDKMASIEVLHELQGEPGTNRINDGKADPTGRLFFGTMTTVGEEIFSRRDGSFFSYTQTEGVKKHLTQIGISNGLAWNADKGVMYYIDSLDRTVTALDWDKSGVKGNRRPVFDLVKQNQSCFPDGMTIDIEGKLWVACFSGSKVLRVDPDSGELLSQVEIPSLNVTSVVWGGPDLSELYVTTAQETDPKGGFTYRVKGLGTKGLPMFDFAI